VFREEEVCEVLKQESPQIENLRALWCFAVRQDSRLRTCRRPEAEKSKPRRSADPGSDRDRDLVFEHIVGAGQGKAICERAAAEQFEGSIECPGCV
jgi:hypothetical protein